MANTSIYNAFERMWQHINNKFATKSAQDASLTEAKAYADAAVASLVDSSPEALNTLNELAAALGNDPNFATTVLTELGKKANSKDLAQVATSGDYNDLENKLELVDSVSSTSITLAAAANSVRKAYNLASSAFSLANENKLKTPLKLISYLDLIELRNNSQLISGMFYQIVDYQCTTTQSNTMALNQNKFDIIVQALSSNNISEDAHVITKKSLNIAVYYKVPVITYNEQFISYLVGSFEYDYNNQGEYVPVLRQNIENAEGNGYILSEDKAFYIGTYELDEEIYDRWIIIEAEQGDSDSFHTWDSISKKYMLTNIIVEDNQFITNDPDSVVVAYEMYDDDSNIYEGNGTVIDCDVIVEVGYKKNIDGTIIPIMYKNDEESFPGTVDYGEVLEYIGRDSYENNIYDKWAMVVTTKDGINIYAYWYTEIIIDDNNRFTADIYGNSSTLSSIHYNAYKIKYCLDNDTSRFRWADEENGKGIVYWMQDEHGNECPYDFKNIQFKLTDDWKASHPEFVEAHGIENIEWFYTFSEIVDGEALEATTRNSEYDFIVHNNIIKMLYDEKYAILPTTVMFASSDGGTHGNYIYNRHPYQTVTVLGERCCNNNINAHNITMAKYSNNNILNNCYNIYAATAIYNSEIKDNSSYIKIISSSTGVKNITIGRNINGRSVSPTIINVAQTNNEPIIYSAPNTKEIILDI